MDNSKIISGVEQAETWQPPKNQDFVLPTFNDVEQFQFETPSMYAGGAPNAYRPGGQETIQIGTGDTVFNVDKNGMWLGAARFSNAPFKVTMSGRLTARLVNDSDSLISDDFGLHSINNFVPLSADQTTDQTLTGTDWIPASSLVLSLTPLSRNAMALVYANVSGYHDDADGVLEFRIMINGVQAGEVFVLNQVADPVAIQTAQMMVPAELPAGNVTIVVEARSSNANSGYLTGATYPAKLGCLLLGK